MNTFENIEQLKAERELYKKDYVIYNLLTDIINELNTTDNPSADCIYNTLKRSYEKTLINKAIDADETKKFLYLEKFIFRPLTEDEIKTIISNCECKDRLDILRYFSKNYANRYSGRRLLQLIDEVIS